MASSAAGVPENRAWTHALRIVTARPWLFAAYLAHYLAFYTLPLGAALVVREVFNVLTGDSAAGLNAWTLLGLLAGVEVTRLVVIFSAAWFGATFHSGLEALLRRNVFTWLVTGPGPRALAHSPGDTVSRMRTDIAGVDDFLEAWMDTAGQMLACIVAILVMLSINVQITLLVVIPLIAVAVITDRLTGRIQTLRRRSAEARAQLTSFMATSFGGIEAARTAGAEANLVRHFDELNTERRRTAVNDSVFDALLGGFSSTAADVGLGVVLLLAAAAMMDGTFTVGDFTLFASYVSLATAGPRWVGRLIARHRHAQVAVTRMDEVLTGSPPPSLTANTLVLEDAPGRSPLSELTVADLSCTATDGAQVLRNASFTINKGEMVAVTGPVGSGKSMLLKAVLGLVPATGHVRWNGQAIDAATFMRPPAAAYTSQVPRLFSGTLEENILPGNTAGRLDDLVSDAALGRDIEAFPDGVRTALGSRGVTLSGGQVQRVAVARMLATGSQLLVMDDVSSALDVDTEALLWERLTTREATILAVTHRRATLHRAARILLMADGAIVASGSFDELMSEPRFAAIVG